MKAQKTERETLLQKLKKAVNGQKLNSIQIPPEWAEYHPPKELKIILPLDLTEFNQKLTQLLKHHKTLKQLQHYYQRLAWRAWRKVYLTVKVGGLTNLKLVYIACTDCKTCRAVNYEHRDYTKPLNIDPVCQSCNLKRGKARRITPEEFNQLLAKL